MPNWRDVVGYEGLYSVSDDGRVLSHGRVGKRTHWPRMLKTVPCQGYPRVGLWKDGKERMMPVHRLVLEAFVGLCPDGMECCHEDGDRSNCQLSNLRWDTHQENMLDAVGHGTLRDGRRNRVAKLPDSAVEEIRRMAADGVRQRVIADLFHVSQPYVSSIVRGKSRRKKSRSAV